MCKIFEGKWVVVTGIFVSFDRHTLRSELRARDALISHKLDKRVDMLIAGDGAGRKLIEAQHLGIRVIHEDELKMLLGYNDHVSETKIPA